MTKKYVLCGCNFGGREFLSVIGREKVAYFCDDNYAGQWLDGVEIISTADLAKIYGAYEVIVTNIRDTANIANNLAPHGIPFKMAFGSGDFFNFWKNLYRLSLLGMNIGGGGDVFDSGEVNALQIMKTNWMGGGTEPILFDVGANVGKYTLILRQIFNTAQIHSFEPGHSTFIALKNNISAAEKNYQEQITLNNFGLSDAETDSTLFYDKAASGLASLYKRQLDYANIDFSQRETVHLTTLDKYCQVHGINEINLLKLDVEGHEISVLNGAANMLSARKIKNIQIEFGGCNLDSRTYFRDFWNLLHERYHVFYILRDSLTEIVKYEEQLEIFTTTNFFFHMRD